VAYSMACEAITRHGCASTAMFYVMHIGSVNAIMLRAAPALADKYIRLLNSAKIGTLSYSDPGPAAILVSDLLGKARREGQAGAGGESPRPGR
jgi:hypothetical protein